MTRPENPAPQAYPEVNRLDPAWSVVSGAGLFALGIVVCGSIASFSPLENSWNIATDFETLNLFGRLGAAIADLLLQTMGWAGWVGGFCLSLAGFQRLIMRARPSVKNWALTFASLLALSCCFAIWPVPKSWPFFVGVGGLIGDICVALLSLPLRAVLLPYPEILGAILAGAACIYWTSLIIPQAIYWVRYGIESLWVVTLHLVNAIFLRGSQGIKGLSEIGKLFSGPKQVDEQAWQANPLLSALAADKPAINHGQTSPGTGPDAPAIPINQTQADTGADDEDAHIHPTTFEPWGNSLNIEGLKQTLSDAFTGMKARFGQNDPTTPKTAPAQPSNYSAYEDYDDRYEDGYDDTLNHNDISDIGAPENNSAGPPTANQPPMPAKPAFTSANSNAPSAKRTTPKTLPPAAVGRVKPRTKRSTASSKPIGVPALSLLDLPKAERSQINEPALIMTAERLSTILKDFGVHGKITEIRPGPVVTLFELEPARGVKSARIIALADDIARSIETISARMAVVPGKNAIGIELPNETRETVYLRDLLESSAYAKNSERLPMALGEDIGGEPTVVNLAKMPHLLIAGTTGSGKSVGVNAMILSLIYRLPPSECRFIMIDPKMLELSIYEGIPHLLCPVVTDPSKAVNALKWAVMEMESRYELMSKTGVRNLAAFNEKAAKYRAEGETLTRDIPVGFDENGEQIIEHETLPTKHIPNIVIIIDEMADLMMVAGKEIEGCVQRLAQMARAAGIHLITATQRPSVDVITGTIKANFPTRISYMVTTKIDSRTILGEQGAEQLLGMGDLLYQAPGQRARRLHGPFVSDEEVENVVNWLKKQGAPDYIEDILDGPDEGSTSAVMDAIMGTTTGDKDEDLYAQAIAIVTTDNRASTSYLQRRLKIGYNKAAGLMDRLEEEGIITAPNHAGKREILGHNRGTAIGS